MVTSDVLDAKVRAKARRTALIRNACDYEHFAAVQPRAVDGSAGGNGCGKHSLAESTRADLLRQLLAPGYCCTTMTP